MVFITSQVPLSSKMTFRYMQRACSAPTITVIWLPQCHPCHLSSSSAIPTPIHTLDLVVGHLWHLKLKPPHQSPSYVSSFLTFLLCHFKAASPLVAFVLVCQAFSISCHRSLFSLPPSSPSSLPTIPRFLPLTNLDTIVGQMKLSHYLPSKPLSWVNCF